MTTDTGLITHNVRVTTIIDWLMATSWRIACPSGSVLHDRIGPGAVRSFHLVVPGVLAPLRPTEVVDLAVEGRCGLRVLSRSCCGREIRCDWGEADLDRPLLEVPSVAA